MSLVTSCDLLIRISARLHVAVVLDRRPASKPTVAAVLRRTVGALARVRVEQGLEARRSFESRVLLLCRDVGEVMAELGDALGVLLLPADHRAVSLALPHALRSLDARAPRELLQRRESQERVEAGLPAGASRERAASPDARGIELERAEERVDVVRDTQGRATRMLVVRRDQAIGRGGDDRMLVLREPDGHWLRKLEFV